MTEPGTDAAGAMSDLLTSDAPATPAPVERRGLRRLVIVVAVVALVAGLLLAADLRGRAIRDQTQRASHDALVASASAWPGMWGQLELAPKDRSIDAITGAASVGVATPGGTFVSTEIVVNDPHTLSVIITTQSDGMVTYVAQLARLTPGGSDTDSAGCDEGTMRDGMACRDWVEQFARHWQG